MTGNDDRPKRKCTETAVPFYSYLHQEQDTTNTSQTHPDTIDTSDSDSDQWEPQADKDRRKRKRKKERETQRMMKRRQREQDSDDDRQERNGQGGREYEDVNMGDGLSEKSGSEAGNGDGEADHRWSDGEVGYGDGEADDKRSDDEAGNGDGEADDKWRTCWNDDPREFELDVLRSGWGFNFHRYPKHGGPRRTDATVFTRTTNPFCVLQRGKAVHEYERTPQEVERDERAIADAVDRFIVQYLVPLGWSDELVHRHLLEEDTTRGDEKLGPTRKVRAFCDMINWWMHDQQVQVVKTYHRKYYVAVWKRRRSARASWSIGEPAHLMRVQKKKTLLDFTRSEVQIYRDHLARIAATFDIPLEKVLFEAQYDYFQGQSNAVLEFFFIPCLFVTGRLGENDAKTTYRIHKVVLHCAIDPTREEKFLEMKDLPLIFDIAAASMGMSADDFLLHEQIRYFGNRLNTEIGSTNWNRARLPPKWERAENLHTSHPALYRAIALQGIRIDKEIKKIRVQADKLIDTYVLQVREDAYQAWQSYEQGQTSA